MKLTSLLLISVLFLASHNLPAQPNGFYQIKKTTIGGEGGWDYLSVDADARRIYISHGSQVEVLNVETHEKIGSIPDTKGVHGIAIVSKVGRGITSNGRTNSATIFDLKTLAKIAELPTGKNPDALLYDPYSGKVFIFNHSGGSATAIDIAAAKVVGTIELGGEGVEAGVSDGNGTIFVNLEDTSEIVSFDSKTFKVKNRWSVAPGEEPTGLAFDPLTRRLFSVCHNELMLIIDADNGNIISQVKIPCRHTT